MEDFSKYKIKDYKYWSIFLHPNQGYLGRCVVWCKRENALDLTDSTLQEQEELFRILKELKEALNKIFKPDLFNYAFLGNETRHLHGHFIPRYASSREFNDVIFTDERFGFNYQTNRNLKFSDDLIEKIRLKIKVALG